MFRKERGQVKDVLRYAVARWQHFRSWQLPKGFIRWRYLLQYGVGFLATIASVAAVILYYGRPYQVPIFDLAVWVIALGFAYGLWGFGVVISLLIEKTR